MAAVSSLLEKMTKPLIIIAKAMIVVMVMLMIIIIEAKHKVKLFDITECQNTNTKKTKS